MKIGVLGTGLVGQTIASSLVESGHEVMMGSRTADHEGAVGWAESAGAETLDGKVLIDLANPLDFSQGMPPTLTVCNTDSLGGADPTRVPGHEGREDLQHGEQRGDGLPGIRAG